jgi:hypothetical protein
MRSKNSKAITPAESEHMRLVKLCACATCSKAGGYAHHTKQGNHRTTIASCWDCHQGSMGWHGDGTMQRIYKVDENDALNITLQRVDELRSAEA